MPENAFKYVVWGLEKWQRAGKGRKEASHGYFLTVSWIWLFCMSYKLHYETLWISGKEYFSHSVFCIDFIMRHAHVLGGHSSSPLLTKHLIEVFMHHPLRSSHTAAEVFLIISFRLSIKIELYIMRHEWKRDKKKCPVPLLNITQRNTGTNLTFDSRPSLRNPWR